MISLNSLSFTGSSVFSVLRFRYTEDVAYYWIQSSLSHWQLKFFSIPNSLLFYNCATIYTFGGDRYIRNR